MERERKDSEKLGPLHFEDNLQCYEQTPCILCDDNFNLTVGFKLFLAHIFDVHHIVIEDVQNIPFFDKYVSFWKTKFTSSPIESVIPTVKVGHENTYYLISSLLKEDKELRHQLRLKYALKIQEIERTDKNYRKGCLFCSLDFEGSRQEFLDHLSSQHNLQLGNPQNLVFIEELIDKIESKLKELVCIYCEKTFPERAILKEHMRKKLHKRINSNNRDYDKYYMINYLEIDKDWQELEKESDRYALPPGEQTNSDEEYSDWNEEEDSINCLFCEHRDKNVTDLCAHMSDAHGFDFFEITKNFEYYQKVKLVNYIRRQMHNSKCPFCDEACDNRDKLGVHLIQENHFKIPDSTFFDQPEYYFPTYENDAFLYFLDDLEDDK